MEQSQKSHRILAVDDQEVIHMTLRSALVGFAEVLGATSASAALEILTAETVDAVILDINMPEVSGIELLKMIRGQYSNLPVLMLTANTDYRSAVDSMKAGAWDYVGKDTADLSTDLKFRLSQAMARAALIKENKNLTQKLVAGDGPNLIGNSTAMIKLRSQISSLKGHSSTVLITGESGVGKELVAKMLNLQEGASRPFVSLNCAAIPEHLAESELFGHERGAFTNAHQRYEGKFVSADGGDLFLDEVGELSLTTQAKLLRALQEKAINPVGSSKTVSIDVRVIAATNRDLDEEVKRGRFREDLYYRLTVIPLKIPSLRERDNDLQLLARHFLSEFGLPHSSFDSKVLEALADHSWPGNVRELRNCIERACIFAKVTGSRVLTMDHVHLEARIATSKNAIEVPKALLPLSENDLTEKKYDEFLKWADSVYLQKSFEVADENKTKLAEKLGLSRDFVHRKLKNYGIAKRSPLI